MTIFVHMGMLKTGTSSIQETLAAAGPLPPFDFLQAGLANGSQAVLRAFFPELLMKQRYGGADYPEGEFERTRALGFEAFEQAFAARTQPHAVFSAETLTQLAPDRLAEFRALFSQHDDLRVVGYVRAPRGYVESVFQEKIKHQPHDLRSDRLRLNYRGLVGKFDTVFGHDAVDLRKYDPATFPGGDVVADFCARLGMDISGVNIVRRNEALSLPAIQLLLAFRAAFPGTRDVPPAIVARLQTFKGRRLRFHSDLIEDVADIPAPGVRWMEERLGVPLDEDRQAGDEQAVRTVEEVLVPSPGAVAWLAAATGRAESKLNGDTAAIGRAVADLARKKA